LNKLEPFRPCGQIPATPAAKLIFLVLREASNDRDFAILPQRKIAETLGISRKAVSANLRRLERAGVIDIEPLYNQYGSRLPNKYRLRGLSNDR
jgi:DNA-binding Lrp family transcriptional regulator